MKLSKSLMCILLREGLEIWTEKDNAEKLMSILEKRQEKGFISIQGQFINIADVIGIFDAKIMEDRTRRKNGQWRKGGKWYNRGDKVCPTCDAVLPYGKMCGRCN